MTDWPVGTIARATVRGVENCTVFRCGGPHEDLCETFRHGFTSRWYGLRHRPPIPVATRGHHFDGVPQLSWLSSAMVPVPEERGESRAHEDDHVTDVRPLVVLDPEKAHILDLPGLLRAMASESIPASGRELTLLWIADEWEKQTARPRMAEPGWGEKVVSHTACDPTRREFVRFGDREYRWSDRDGFRWDELLDPEPFGGVS